MSDDNKVPLQPMVPNRLKMAENERVVYRCISQIGVTKDDLLKSEYWQHVSKKLKPFDKIEVRAEDNSFYAELLVLAANKAFVKVAGLSYVELDVVKEEDLVLPEGFEIRFRGAIAKWSVIRSKGKKVLSEGHDTKTAALAWLNEHMKSL